MVTPCLYSSAQSNTDSQGSRGDRPEGERSAMTRDKCGVWDGAPVALVMTALWPRRLIDYPGDRVPSLRGLLSWSLSPRAVLEDRVRSAPSCWPPLSHNLYNAVLHERVRTPLAAPEHSVGQMCERVSASVRERGRGVQGRECFGEGRSGSASKGESE